MARRAVRSDKDEALACRFVSVKVASFGKPFPEYDLALIAIGPLVRGALWVPLNRTRRGTLVRAAPLEWCE